MSSLARQASIIAICHSTRVKTLRFPLLFQPAQSGRSHDFVSSVEDRDPHGS